MKKSSIWLALVFVLSLAPQLAHASLLWDFTLTNNNGVYGPNDNITVLGNIKNNSTAGETIGNLSFNPDYYISSISTGITGFDYGFDLKPGFWSQFDGVNLNPGDSLDFTIGDLVPKHPIAEGDYSLLSIGFGIRQRDSRITISDNEEFNWKVSNAAVPEPMTMMLLGGGLAGMAIRRRAKR